MPTSREIRQQYIDFFVDKHAHRNVPSSPVVPHDDPTLLFANAGMNQFKPYFLGTESPPDPPRAVNTQKCIRAGGKHNDLEDVGRDTYHHTFFEMLGNWSFGDYFKAEAIDWAWELLTDVWGLDPERLHATYFEGDAAEGLQPDDEARELWLKHLPPGRVHPGNKKDNFWEMGDTGPCGPCSELHYDNSPGKSAGHLVNADDQDTVVEIWNLVFIQFNRAADGKLRPLPAQHVDTGMGFERIVRVLQDKASNYDTDVFTPLFDATSKATGARPYAGGLDDKIDTAYRVIADHARCLTFAITDGAVPGNEGRGYVLRRILRRAVKYGRIDLGCEKPFLHQLVQTVVDTMGDAFPELAAEGNAERVAAILRDEEESFGRTLERGVALFEEAATSASPPSQGGAGGGSTVPATNSPPPSPLPGRERGPTISADDAFTLYDTYGFPLDLTELMAAERGMTVDTAGFEQLMEQARQRSRADGGSADAKASLVDLVQQEDLPATEFVGYDATELSAESQPLRVFVLGEHGYTPADSASAGQPVAVVLGRTPFYAEAGGQVGDTGVIQVGGSGGARVDVEDTQKVGGVWFHLGRVAAGEVAGGEAMEVASAVDAERRADVMANHTGTHLMNLALRAHVSETADQRGSLVAPDRLRFDFTHDASLAQEQAAAVDHQVNELIDAAMPVHADEAPQADALKIHGLRAVFGEKYPPRVRVVSVGQSVDDLLAEPGSERWAGRSIEFCGGTHVANTRDIGGFALVSQESVSKGVRRVTALTGQAARAARYAAGQLQAKATQVLDNASAEEPTLDAAATRLAQALEQQTLPLVEKQQLQQTLTKLQDRLKAARKQAAAASAEGVVEEARKLADAHDGGPVLVARLDADGNALRSAMDVLRKRLPDTAVLLGGATDGKVALVASVPKPMIASGLKAGDWVKSAAQIVGGGGGGRPDMAQAGGKNPAALDGALDQARRLAAEVTSDK